LTRWFGLPYAYESPTVKHEIKVQNNGKLVKNLLKRKEYHNINKILIQSWYARFYKVNDLSGWFCA